MMTVRAAFEEFLQSLELSDRERGDASNQHTNMRTQLQKLLDVEKNFLSGSVLPRLARNGPENW